jgi:hypothetical protein
MIDRELILININNKINIYQTLMLWFIENNDLYTAKKYVDAFGVFEELQLDYLLNEQYVVGDKYDFNSLSVTNKYRNLHKKKDSDVDQWIDEWFELFPKGIKSGGYYTVRCDKQGCIKKLRNFIKNNPEFDKSIIIQATKNYVNEAALQGYAYMKTAPYFIEKSGVSLLAGFCEAIINKEDNKIVDNIEDV